MANLSFDPKVVESERGVVYCERRSSIDDDNFGTLIEQMQATAWTAHPYQFPTIGWPTDIEGWKAEDLKKFFKTYYAPNNAVLVVAGDVDPAQVFALADKYLASLPKQPAPTPVTTVEPEQQGERRLVVERADAQSPIVAYALPQRHRRGQQGLSGAGIADHDPVAGRFLAPAPAPGRKGTGGHPGRCLRRSRLRSRPAVDLRDAAARRRHGQGRNPAGRRVGESRA